MTTTTAIGKSDLVRREFAIREIREESREIDFIASTDAMDSYGEVVAQNWRLERYSSNPVFLWSHKSGDLPIGKSVRTEVRNGRLEFTAKFASAKANPFAEQVFQSYREGNLRGVSVGFYPHTVRVERRNDQDVVVLDDNELYEISATSIPANSEAIAQRIRAACSNTSPPIERGADTKKEEPTMDFEKEAATLKAQVADRDASIASLKTERDSALKSVETLKGELEQRTTERDENAKRAADAETKLIEQEVDGLVG
ncbi:MAG: HK97 family phage prohead protease, partial [Solirubrobacterales bacterium]